MTKAIESGLDLSFSMGESARIIKKESTKNFILKGSGKYPPLSPGYFKRKQILAPGAPILTGAKWGIVDDGERFHGGGMCGKLKNSLLEKLRTQVYCSAKIVLRSEPKSHLSKARPIRSTSRKERKIKTDPKKWQLENFYFSLSAWSNKSSTRLTPILPINYEILSLSYCKVFFIFFIICDKCS